MPNKPKIKKVRRKKQYPTNIDELHSSDFQQFMSLRFSLTDREVKIYARHRQAPEIVFVFHWDGIHYIDRIETYYECPPPRK